MVTRGLVALMVIMLLQVPLLALPTSTTDVTLTIDPYLDIVIDKGIAMTVRTEDFYKDPPGGRKVLGSSPVTVKCNTAADVWCPKATTVTNTEYGSYEMECDLSLIGPNPAYSATFGGAPLWVLEVGPGAYYNQIFLQVDRKQLWTAADHAGIYTGTVWMYIVAHGSSTPY